MSQSLIILVYLAMKGLIETPGLPKQTAAEDLQDSLFLRVLYLSHSCLLVGGLQENRTTHAVTLKFCLAKALPFET